jgi:hypothetical protein
MFGLIKFSVSSILILTLSGCASGLYIKASPEKSIEALLNVHNMCESNLSDEERKIIEGKLFPNEGIQLYQSDFNNPIFPTADEKIILAKAYNTQLSCRQHYIQWSRDYAPLSYNIVNNYSQVNIEITRQLSIGQISYAVAAHSLINNFNILIPSLEALEFKSDENKKASNRALLDAYLNRIGSSPSRNINNNTLNSNNNLIHRCSSQGKTANFGTGGCF